MTANTDLLKSKEDELQGGRQDDGQRASDLQGALSDDDVVAIIALRGGAWFTRILRLIDFSVLDRRVGPVAVFGFSELSTLVNIVAGHPMGRGVYDMGPAFLSYGLKRHAEAVLRLPVDSSAHPSADEWARRELLPQLQDFFRDVILMIEGRGSRRPVEAQLVCGEIPAQSDAEFVGGNLSVLTTLLGSPFRRSIEPGGRWLFLEDLNEKPERIDRFLAHLTLAGIWEQCGGILLGDFHRREQQLTTAVAAMLRYHLPANRGMPVLITSQVGHVWPMSPLPLRIPMTIREKDEKVYSLQWPEQSIRVV